MVADVSAGNNLAGPKKKKEKMTHPAFQPDPAVPALSTSFTARNEINPTCRPSVLERLFLKGAYAKVEYILQPQFGIMQ